MILHHRVVQRNFRFFPALAVALVLTGSVWAAETKGPPALATVGPKPKPVETPKPEVLDRAIDRGVEFLVKRQNKDGSWGSARNTKGLNIYAPVPGAPLARARERPACRHYRTP